MKPLLLDLRAVLLDHKWYWLTPLLVLVGAVVLVALLNRSDIAIPLRYTAL